MNARYAKSLGICVFIVVTAASVGFAGNFASELAAQWWLWNTDLFGATPHYRAVMPGYTQEELDAHFEAYLEDQRRLRDQIEAEQAAVKEDEMGSFWKNGSGILISSQGVIRCDSCPCEPGIRVPCCDFDIPETLYLKITAPTAPGDYANLVIELNYHGPGEINQFGQICGDFDDEYGTWSGADPVANCAMTGPPPYDIHECLSCEHVSPFGPDDYIWQLSSVASLGFVNCNVAMELVSCNPFRLECDDATFTYCTAPFTYVSVPATFVIEP